MGMKSEHRDDGHGDIRLSHGAVHIALVKCDSWHRLAERRDMIDHRPNSVRVAVEGRAWGLPYASISGVKPGPGHQWSLWWPGFGTNARSPGVGTDLLACV